MKERQTVKIRLHADIEMPQKIVIGDWIDLRSSEDVIMKAGEMKFIDLGVSMELPEGYEAYIAPRSSTLKNFGVLCGNSFGIIDNSFCGDNDIWKFCAYAVRDTHIQKGDRICQFRIFEHQPAGSFEETDHLEGTDRGGFGSTGKN